MKTKSWMRALLVSGVLAGCPALADEAFETCMKSSSPEDPKCGEEWIAREQTKLDATWQKLMSVADGHVAEALDAEQRAWMTFRDTACNFKLDEGFGGAGGPTGYHACRAQTIAEREATVDGYVKYIDN